jgi:acetyl esterase/lipase
MSASLRKRAALGVVSMLSGVFMQLATAQEAAVQPQPATIEGAVSRVYKSVNGVDLRLHPVVDTSEESDAARSGGRGTGTLAARFGERRRDGSPMHHLRSGLAPTLILHGKADTTIPYSDVARFCAAASTLGERCELVGYEGAPHGFFNPQRDGGKWYRETLAEADRFLTGLGYLRPLPR